MYLRDCMWLYVTICPCLWLYVAICACLWLYVIICACLWLYVTICACVLPYVTLCACLWLYVTKCTCMWLYVTKCTCVWLYVTVCDYMCLFVTVRDYMWLWSVSIVFLVSILGYLFRFLSMILFFSAVKLSMLWGLGRSTEDLGIAGLRALSRYMMGMSHGIWWKTKNIKRQWKAMKSNEKHMSMCKTTGDCIELCGTSCFAASRLETETLEFRERPK